MKAIITSLRTDIPVPAISDGEVLVKVTNMTLSATDLKLIDVFSPDASIMGCDFAGVVAKCDRERPCQLCVRAGAECVPRNIGAADSASSTAKRPTTDAEPSSLDHIPSSDTASKTSPGDDLVMPDSSIVDLTALVLSKMSLGSSLHQDTSALPGGNKLIGPERLGRPHWRQIVALQLPDDLILEQFVDKFFVSVDWFIMVFHEQLFRERFAKLLGSSHVAYHEENFLWLCMLVVALGAHYTSISQAHTPSQLELRQLTACIIMQIETRFLQFLGCATLEAVQISILMGSFLLFSGRPNVGLGISAAGVKIAQVINLHRENLWRDCSAAETETRRRTWWALEVFDK
ncbi:Transcription factor [Cordyceps fumosorosea ARSEF 2679]|uniref:Transcription factor n=1 Tax=Cordyceps fumosorosea (strain ARSEF 2679) TaxID=1081104 RepID=A0A167BNJ2_CORFA|nr:Transcription factor [Cordyceps fumosorosea ARSEF 2679]OAA40237.1 Transcription factor [Cordyceps fumosorosea ARSEF 2679]